MSMWVYFRSLEASRLPEDNDGFEALFDVEFEDLRAWERAGEGVWLERGFFQLNDLYRSPSPRRADDGELAVFGGRHIPAPGSGPGHVAVDPPDVARAAAFLESASFPELWQRYVRVTSPAPDDELRETLAGHHEDLLAFYRTAATRGWAVARYFCF